MDNNLAACPCMLHQRLYQIAHVGSKQGSHNKLRIELNLHEAICKGEAVSFWTAHDRSIYLIYIYDLPSGLLPLLGKAVKIF